MLASGRLGPSLAPPVRVLLVDDNAAIHKDYRKVLAAPDQAPGTGLEDLENALFGEVQPGASQRGEFAFEVDSAFQGEEGLQMLNRSVEERRPYMVAFVDMRMPPGWDGLETVGRLWAVAPELQVVICTAFSDYTWARILERLKRQDGLLILKKPFDGIEVLQLAHSLATKWFLQREVSRRFIDLQALIAERTQALSEANRALREEIHRREQTEQQLVESQKLEGLGQLAAGIAHEINNPMAFVTANVQCLAADLRGIPALPEPLREYRDEVIPATLEGIARVNAIVADVGRFALADPGTELEYDLNHEVQNAVRIVQGRVKSSQRLQAELGKLPPLRGKPSQIAQVAVNLLANALHATDGGGLVRVRTYAEGDEQVLEVADDGPGVAPEARKKLFVPFFTTKAVGDGPGLGLSVIHGIVKAHGGRIDVRSEPGLGTSFVVRLPMATAQARA